MKKIAVVGGGSFGGTLALLLYDKGYPVHLWEFLESEVARYEQGDRELAVLPGIHLPSDMPVSNDLAEVVKDAELILLAVPSHAVRNMAAQLNHLVSHQPLVVDVAKGIENDSLLRMSQVVAETAPNLNPERYVCLSGPSHAEEVSRKIPTTVAVASLSDASAILAQEVFSAPHFRVYTNSDLVGVEMAGAVKNVIAIAAGICDGLGYGDNTKGALLTRGLTEISRLGVAMGARRETFFGLSGMGDLITTCMSRHSRNRHVGEQIGRGRKLDEILDEMNMVAEGVKTTRSTYDLMQRTGIEMPITESVYQVLFDGVDPAREVLDLMTRKLKEESE